MPITVNRVTGEVFVPEITDEQREKLFGTIVQAYIDHHPEVFDETEKR